MAGEFGEEFAAALTEALEFAGAGESLLGLIGLTKAVADQIGEVGGRHPALKPELLAALDAAVELSEALVRAMTFAHTNFEVVAGRWLTNNDDGEEAESAEG